MSPDRQPLMTDEQAVKISRRQTLKGVAMFGAAAAAAYGSWKWLMSQNPGDFVPWPMQRVLRFNEMLSERLFRNQSRMDELPPGTAPPNPRLNSSIGVDGSMTDATYRLSIAGVKAGSQSAVTLTLADIKAFPKIRQTTRLCCVEGWSTWGNWAGTRLADVLAKYSPVGSPPYVAMSTAGNDYYVGLDIASALHPQTLLVYELDGQPISLDHGYPLRLVIPTKYGIKNIKQVSHIELTHTRPPDFWAEQGYDWYAGL